MQRDELLSWGVIAWIWAPRTNAPSLTSTNTVAGDASQVTHSSSQPSSFCWIYKLSFSCHLTFSSNFNKCVLSNRFKHDYIAVCNHIPSPILVSQVHLSSTKNQAELILLLPWTHVVLLLVADDITTHPAPSSSPLPATWDSYSCLHFQPFLW